MSTYTRSCQNYFGVHARLCQKKELKTFSHFKCPLWPHNTLDVCLSVHRCICVEKKNQLDITECFIALMICSTCSGHFYVHHQELETICVLLPSMVCSAWLLVVGGQVRGSRLCVQKRNAAASLFLDSQPAALHLTPDNQQPSTAHHRG